MFLTQGIGYQNWKKLKVHENRNQIFFPLLLLLFSNSFLPFSLLFRNCLCRNHFALDTWPPETLSSCLIPGENYSNHTIRWQMSVNISLLGTNSANEMNQCKFHITFYKRITYIFNYISQYQSSLPTIIC